MAKFARQHLDRTARNFLHASTI